jgi:deazaflavin-dependent oxidoreductase (nitroreductase family)
VPREIEIWFTRHDGRLYIIAEYPTSQWVRNLQANPVVQVSVAGQRFGARARILSDETDSGVRVIVQELSRQKYGWAEGTVVELIPDDQ